MDTIDPSGITTSYTSLNTWYAANESAIASAATAISSLSLDTKSIDSALSSFVETSDVVMKGLDALGQLHPFVGGQSCITSVEAILLTFTPSGCPCFQTGCYA